MLPLLNTGVATTLATALVLSEIAFNTEEMRKLVNSTPQRSVNHPRWRDMLLTMVGLNACANGWVALGDFAMRRRQHDGLLLALAHWSLCSHAQRCRYIRTFGEFFEKQEPLPTIGYGLQDTIVLWRCEIDDLRWWPVPSRTNRID